MSRWTSRRQTPLFAFWLDHIDPGNFITHVIFSTAPILFRTTQPCPLECEIKDKDLRAFELEPGDTLLFDFRTLHGTTAAPIKRQRRAFSTRWLGDDMVYFERPGETSPPLKDLGVKPGMRMPEDLFPVVWTVSANS